MKKLLGILESISLTATGTSNIIACGEGKPKQKQPVKPHAQKKNLKIIK